MVPALTGIGWAKLACCQPDPLSPVKLTWPSLVPVPLHSVPTWVPVFAAALAVPLSRQATVTCADVTNLTECQSEVDEREDGIDALALLLRPAAGEYHRRPVREPPRGSPQLRFRHAGQLFDAGRVVLKHGAAHRVEAGRALADERRVE